MSTEEFDIDKLRAYLLGRLSDQEKSAFDARLNNDPEFKKEATIYVAILAGIEQHFDRTLKKRLQNEERRTLFNIKALWFAMAACTTGIIIVSFLYLFDKPDGPALYQQYYKPYYNVISEYRRGNEPKTDDYNQAFQFYERKEYSEATKKLSVLLAKNPSDQNLQFYLGLSHLADGKSDSASFYLHKVTQSDHKLAEPAAWYLGLSYMQSDDRNSARLVFSEIARSNSSYRQRAAKILDDLD